MHAASRGHDDHHTLLSPAQVIGLRWLTAWTAGSCWLLNESDEPTYSSPLPSDARTSPRLAPSASPARSAEGTMQQEGHSNRLVRVRPGTASLPPFLPRLGLAR